MSAEIQRVQTDARMSHVVVANGVVYLAGQVSGTAQAPIKQQATEVLARIDTLLASAGVDRTRLLTANVWLSDACYFDEFNAVWDAWVSPGNTPARATVEAKLATPDYKVEIMVVAAK